MSVIIQSVGKYIPARAVSNEEISALSGQRISSEEIRAKSHIETRHFANPEDTVVSMAVAAALTAVREQDIEKIGAIYFIANTPPPDFTHTQNLLRLSHVSAQNINDLLPYSRELIHKLVAKDKRFRKAAFYARFGGCAHWLSSVIDAYQDIEDRNISSAVVVTSTDISRYLDFNDTTTSILFGDGACAALLKIGDTPRILAFYEKEDKSLDHLLGYRKNQDRWYVDMHQEGYSSVFRHTAYAVKDCFRDLREKGYTNVDHFLFHQANGVVLDSITRKQGIPQEKMYMTIQKVGNTSSASLGSGLSFALEEGIIKPGEKVLLLSFGAGFRWNYVLLQY